MKPQSTILCPIFTKYILLKGYMLSVLCKVNIREITIHYFVLNFYKVNMRQGGVGHKPLRACDALSPWADLAILYKNILNFEETQFCWSLIRAALYSDTLFGVLTLGLSSAGQTATCCFLCTSLCCFLCITSCAASYPSFFFLLSSTFFYSFTSFFCLFLLLLLIYPSPIPV